jgi:hypothetical protein
MPDERKPIQERLGKLDVEPCRQEEIERELGEHLADLASALEARGVTREAAAKASLESVSDWRQLGKDISAAEMEETMNHRTRALWLPAVGALFASYGLTAIIQVCAPLTHSPWLNPLITVRPGYFPWYVLLLPWVALQPLVGAVSASWSRRAGGSLREQLVAALAPAIPAIIWLLVIVVVTIPMEVVLVAMHPSVHISGRGVPSKMEIFAIWALLQALSLLIGAAPFLRRPQPQST